MDKHVTPHLARLGYARIGAYENERSSRAPLVAAARHRLLGRLNLRRTRRVHLTGEPDQLAMGYEALDEQAAARLFPGDPASDEVWLYFDLSSGSLDLTSGMRLPDLVGLHGAPGDDLVILSPEQPLATRLERLDQVLDGFVRSLLPP